MAKRKTDEDKKRRCVKLKNVKYKYDEYDVYKQLKWDKEHGQLHSAKNEEFKKLEKKYKYEYDKTV